ncbi:hypothetical protein D8S78_10355 [Natrialba swarupiae]|nr:hypothetical protein [Natrialba swarupiae]
MRATSDETDDLPRAELAKLNECNCRLAETPRDADRPLSADEIRSRANLTPAEFDRLREIHGESGPIDRLGTGYRLDEREMGLTGILRTIGRRLLRPVRVLRPGGEPDTDCCNCVPPRRDPFSGSGGTDLQ